MKYIPQRCVLTLIFGSENADRPDSSAQGRVFPLKQALFRARERWRAKLSGLGTAFPCIPTHFNPWYRHTGPFKYRRLSSSTAERWRGGATVGRRTLDREVAGPIPVGA